MFVRITVMLQAISTDITCLQTFFKTFFKKVLIFIKINYNIKTTKMKGEQKMIENLIICLIDIGILVVLPLLIIGLVIFLFLVIQLISYRVFKFNLYKFLIK